jgi:hypothetical protein
MNACVHAAHQSSPAVQAALQATVKTPVAATRAQHGSVSNIFSTEIKARFVGVLAVKVKRGRDKAEPVYACLTQPRHGARPDKNACDMVRRPKQGGAS